MSNLRTRRPVQFGLALGLALQVFAMTASVPPSLAEDVARPMAGLVDQDGRPYDGPARADGIRLVVFGYTNCPDICPTTLSDVSLALSSIEAGLRGRVSPVFVTVDPRRDTSDVLKAYLQPFGPTFSGVTGTVEAIDAYAWANGVYAMRNDGSGSSSYSVDHSTSLLLIAPDDTVVDRIPYATAPKDLAKRIEDAARATPARP